MTYYGLDWLGTLFGLASIYCLGQRKHVGFVLRILASLFWVAFGIVAGTAAGVIANIAVIVLSIKGMQDWKRAEIGFQRIHDAEESRDCRWRP